jgi:phosphoribosylformylglycinamidine cyclo-ligase
MQNIFKWFQENGNISDDDMYRIFNCGIGMVLFVDEDEELNISSRIKALKMNSFVIGRVKNKKEESSVIFV